MKFRIFIVEDDDDTFYLTYFSDDRVSYDSNVAEAMLFGSEEEAASVCQNIDSFGYSGEKHQYEQVQ